MFNNIKVSTRLALGFGAVVALVILTSVTRVLRLATVHQASAVIMDEVYPKVLLAEDIELVQEIAAASAEQTSGVGQINAAVTQMSQTTQENAAGSEELAETAEEMSAQAERLQQSVAFFKLAGGNSAIAIKRAAKAGTGRGAKDHSLLKG